MTPLKPIAADYLGQIHIIKPGDRLHRLISRLSDTYIDDLSDERVEDIERLVDTYRLTHADGTRINGGGRA